MGGDHAIPPWCMQAYDIVPMDGQPARNLACSRHLGLHFTGELVDF